ncbi:MAG TPA: aldo/keto reductase [Candidatus Limnocylindria bacterium]|nr:aldo/keto reductase [Candidatus Limnocylindria bacterium]
MKPLRRATLPGGEQVPVLGQGTYRMGEDREKRRTEVGALRSGIELGMTVIDTAEMYADGGAERVVGEAIANVRDDVFIVTKFYPQNATRKRMREACERSLKRLGTDRIDLYLLHWRGDVPLRETIAGFDDLLADEKIRYAGVSNFDVDDLEELSRLKEGLRRVVTDQVLFNLIRRGAESSVLPWSRQRRRPIMAYSPLEEGLLSHRAHPTLAEIAGRHDATAAQVALAWVIRTDDVIAIPKSSRVAHVRENRGAADIHLTRRDLDQLEESFPAPETKIPLEVR